MIIDCHTHIGFENKLENQTPEELLKMMDEAGVDKAVIFPFAPIKIDGSMKEENEKIAALCSNERFIGFGRINQLSSDCLEEVDRIIKLGLKGVKFHTLRSSLVEAQPALDKLSKYKLPIIVHTGNDDNANVKNLANIEYPGPVIIGHAGKDNTKEAVRLVNERENFYLELSIVSLFRTKWILEKVNENKILFGSDAPFSHPRLDLLKIKYAVKDEKVRKKILGDNLISILNKNRSHNL